MPRYAVTQAGCCSQGKRLEGPRAKHTLGSLRRLNRTSSGSTRVSGMLPRIVSIDTFTGRYFRGHTNPFLTHGIRMREGFLQSKSAERQTAHWEAHPTREIVQF